MFLQHNTVWNTRELKDTHDWLMPLRLTGVKENVAPPTDRARAFFAMALALAAFELAHLLTI